MYYHYNTYLSILDFFSQVTFSSYNYFTDVLKLCKLDFSYSLCSFPTALSLLLQLLPVSTPTTRSASSPPSVSVPTPAATTGCPTTAAVVFLFLPSLLQVLALFHSSLFTFSLSLQLPLGYTCLLSISISNFTKSFVILSLLAIKLNENKKAFQ